MCKITAPAAPLSIANSVFSADKIPFSLTNVHHVVVFFACILSISSSLRDTHRSCPVTHFNKTTLNIQCMLLAVHRGITQRSRFQ